MSQPAHADTAAPEPRRVVNARGPATILGAARAIDEVAAAAAAALGRSVHMSELQSRASATAERVLGVPAACVTGCSAAGIAIGLSACITGADLGRITAVPEVTGPRAVLLPKAHMITAGGLAINQLVHLAGGVPLEVGEAADCASYHVAAGLERGPAAALYVLGERANAGGIVPLATFARLCRQAGVPVLVDAAGETDPARHLDAGADLVVFSGHKWFRGATAGAIAGRPDLVHAAYLVGEFGIGRAMKVGKEGIAGLIAALEAWEAGKRPADPVRHRQMIDWLAEQLGGLPGLGVRALDGFAESGAAALLRVDVDPARAGVAAWELSRTLEEDDPSVTVDDYQAADGYLVIDPGFLDDGDERLVAERIAAAVERFQAAPSPRAHEPSPARFDVMTEAAARWRWSPR